eukprot:394134-Pyramimonas_sp.AAC.1
MNSFCECVDDRGHLLHLLIISPRLVGQLAKARCSGAWKGNRARSSEFPTVSAGALRLKSLGPA